MTNPLPHPNFPCDALPSEARLARLLGVYPQREEGLHLQRVRIPGGRLTGAQWRAIAAIAREFAPATPLHLTTRQDIEIHDLAADQFPAVQRRLADAGLSGLGGCGDTLRNVTVCACSGLRGKPDLMPLALRIQQELQSQDWVFDLPRKFKTSLSACKSACAQPWINDLGLIATERDGQPGFEVIAAGSLGPKPATGVRCFDFIPATDAIPLAIAALRVFHAHGDRKSRGTARLRHVRQRLGDGPFVAMLREEFDRARAEKPAAAPVPVGNADPMVRQILTFPNGDVSPAAADALGQLADTLPVRILADHRVVVFAADAATIASTLAPVLADAARPQPTVVACPGTKWCHRGLADTRSLANRIRAELASQFTAGPTVRISGCPNGCAQSGVARIGLVGRATGPVADRRQVFDLSTGGDDGRGPALATPAESALSPDAVLARLATLGR
ncbi:MAG: nitrite/sulfite reductase [Phycisphaerae bacterium]|nr:nitrite/sulfite reductase [Phycisphaerae bacterium]